MIWADAESTTPSVYSRFKVRFDVVFAQDALQSDDLAAVRRAVEQGARAPSVPFRRWVAAAYYLNKDRSRLLPGAFFTSPLLEHCMLETRRAKHSQDLINQVLSGRKHNKQPYFWHSLCRR